MKWIFTPYAGVNDLKFGMTLKDVENIYGPPEKIIKRKINIHHSRVRWKNTFIPTLEFDNDILTEITFFPDNGEFIVCGMDALSTNPITFLKGIVEHDKDTLADYPEISSYKLGITFDMYGLGNADKCFTIFARGIQDQFIPDMKPVVPSDYTISGDDEKEEDDYA